MLAIKELSKNLEKNKLILDGEFRSVFLTGGRTSRKVYEAIANNKNFYKLSGINFFMGDERLLPKDSVDSNYRLISETLFVNGIPDGCNFFPMPSDSLGLKNAIIDYEKIIPKEIDLILLSWGEDGHLASIFPGEEGLTELDKLVMYVLPKFYPFERISITPKLLSHCKSAYIFAEGDIKSRSIEGYRKRNRNKIIYPASYLKNITWFIDQNPEIIAEKIITTLLDS